LERTNSELLQLTLELDDRVAELQTKNEEIRAVSQQLWQAAKLATMGELAASIAHELNNPLATVSLRVEVLLGQMSADAHQRRALEVIQREVERMGQLVANLLQTTRRGQQQVSTLNVREEIEFTLELIHYHLRNRHIAVVCQFAPDVPMVQADHQQLRQLFLNLFTNASDAMPQGGTLTLQVKTDPPGLQIEIVISDTGVGIASENLPRVMEPFFTTKPEGRGTGLGLPICRRIVQEHQGTLNIVSTVQQGTTVFITLPTQYGQNGASFIEAQESC
jgi:signal transduction histidine kinase